MRKVRFRRERVEKWASYLAQILLTLPHVRTVLLTGSLARLKEVRLIGDIDLVVLHDGQLPDTAFSVIKGRHVECLYLDEKNKIFTGSEGLEMFGEDSVPVLLKSYLEDEVHCPVDIFCADFRVLEDCFFLGRFAAINKDPDFARRVFCELPMLEFDHSLGRFRDRVLHKSGVCCKPEKSWKEKKKEREASEK